MDGFAYTTLHNTTQNFYKEVLKNIISDKSFNNFEDSTLNTKMKEMKKIFGILLGLMICGTTFAQKIDFTNATQSDKEAKAILDKIKTNLDGFDGIDAAFEYKVSLPEEKDNIQKGNMLVVGEKYALDLNEYSIYCDTETIWMYDKEVNEVNINNVEENEDILISSPTDLLTFYQQDDFVYAFYDEIVEGNTIVTMIDFKPIDGDQEFFKIRLSVNKKTNLPLRAKVFYKDGARIEVTFKTIKNTSGFKDGDFILTKEKVGEDVEFIDLRY